MGWGALLADCRLFRDKAWAMETLFERNRQGENETKQGAWRHKESINKSLFLRDSFLLFIIFLLLCIH